MNEDNENKENSNCKKNILMKIFQIKDKYKIFNNGKKTKEDNIDEGNKSQNHQDSDSSMKTPNKFPIKETENNVENKLEENQNKNEDIKDKSFKKEELAISVNKNLNNSQNKKNYKIEKDYNISPKKSEKIGIVVKSAQNKEKIKPNRQEEKNDKSTALFNIIEKLKQKRNSESKAKTSSMNDGINENKEINENQSKLKDIKKQTCPTKRKDIPLPKLDKSKKVEVQKRKKFLEDLKNELNQKNDGNETNKEDESSTKNNSSKSNLVNNSYSNAQISQFENDEKITCKVSYKNHNKSFMRTNTPSMKARYKNKNEGNSCNKIIFKDSTDSIDKSFDNICVNQPKNLKHNKNLMCIYKKPAWKRQVSQKKNLNIIKINENLNNKGMKSFIKNNNSFSIHSPNKNICAINIEDKYERKAKNSSSKLADKSFNNYQKDVFINNYINKNPQNKRKKANDPIIIRQYDNNKFTSRINTDRSFVHNSKGINNNNIFDNFDNNRVNNNYNYQKGKFESYNNNNFNLERYQNQSTINITNMSNNSYEFNFYPNSIQNERANYPYQNKIKEKEIKNISINIEDLLILEEKYYQIVHFYFKTKSVYNECFEFWNYYFNCSLYGCIESLFINTKDYQNIKNIINYILITVIICYEFSFEIYALNGEFSILEDLLNLNHKNLMVMYEYILSKISIENKSNLWVFKLRDLINNFNRIENNDAYYMSINVRKKITLIDKINYNSSIIVENLRVLLKNYKTKNTPYITNLFKIIHNVTYEEINTIFLDYILRVPNINGSILGSVFLKDNEFFQTESAPYIKTKNRKPYSLVLDLDETLIHFKINNENDNEGVLQLRPGLIPFLEEVGYYYELIVFTAATQDYGDLLIDAIEENNLYFEHRFYRQHTVIMGKDFIKDISRIGRPLDKIIIVDNMPQNFRLQKENGINIKAFWGEDVNDNALEDLGIILINIAREGGDVRIGLEKYKDESVRKVTANISKINYQ